MWLNLQSNYDLRCAKRDLWPKIDARVNKAAAE